MTAKIIPFSKKNTAVPHVVQLLEHQLALAKEGKISFVALAVLNEQNVAYSAWTPDEFASQARLTSAIGAVAFLSARFNDAVVSNAEEVGPDEAA